MVVETLRRGDHLLARCSPEGHQTGRSIELPLWMLDRAACLPMRRADGPVVPADALRRLKELLGSARGRTDAGAVQ